MGFWANGASCDIASHFQDHVLTIDTTICGDWAGSAYESSGCPGTCADAVADPKNFVGMLLAAFKYFANIDQGTHWDRCQVGNQFYRCI